jgi:phosphoglycolate phosphatase-like HAD superfamily hydrolase
MVAHMTDSVQAVIFDFDDTMSDTLPGRILTVQEAVRQVLEGIRGSSNIESQMVHLSGGNRAMAEHMVEVFRHLYYDSGRASLSLFPGMAEALEHLQNSGMRLALVTSRHRAGANGKPTHGVLWELQRMGLSNLFEVVVGHEDTVEHKPAPDPFTVCLQQLRLDGGAAIAIGDAPSDILGAQAAGVRAAAALWGSNDPAAVLATGPDFVLNAPGDLASLL